MKYAYEKYMKGFIPKGTQFTFSFKKKKSISVESGFSPFG